MNLWFPEMRSGGAELYFHSQVRAFNMEIDYRKGPWWNEILGLIHVQGEHALNLEKNVMWSWVDGQKWSDDYKHRDLPQHRLDILKAMNGKGAV